MREIGEHSVDVHFENEQVEQEVLSSEYKKINKRNKRNIKGVIQSR